MTDGERAKTWDQCDDPLILIEILKDLKNPNYDLSLIGFLARAVEAAKDASDNTNYQKLLTLGAKNLKEYTDGTLDLVGLRKEQADFELRMRQVYQEDKDLSIFDKQMIYGTHLAISWLVEGGLISASRHFVKASIITPEVAKLLSELLKECVGNPFLT